MKVLGWGTLVALLVPSVPAMAQETALSGGAARVSAATDPQFEELMRSGIELRRQGKDALAVERFEEALALQPDSARAKVHLGTAHHALGDWLTASEHLREALDSSEDPYVARHRGDLERELDVVAGHLGTLSVLADADGAQIRLNGRLVGTLPLQEPITVAVGSYRMAVERAGYFPAVRDVSITPRSLSRVSVELERTDDTADALWAPRWVPWTLGGLGAVGALTSAAALYEREKYAGRWNDCFRLNPEADVGVARSTLCAGERRNISRADSVLLWSGGISAALLTGAVITGLLKEREASEEPGATAEVACGLGIATLVCAGRF